MHTKKLCFTLSMLLILCHFPISMFGNSKETIGFAQKVMATFQQKIATTIQQQIKQPTSVATVYLSPTDVCQSLNPTQIGGTVFEDWNYDGLMNQSDTIGIKGVQVELFDDCNAISQSIATNSDGDYLFTGLNAGTTYRIEFSIPDSLSWAKPTQAGADNGTMVQFVIAGDCASLGLASPADYCETNPLVAIPCYVNGDPTGGGTAAGVDWFVYFRNDNEGEIGEAGYTEPEIKIDGSVIGSTWGTAYHRSTKTVLAGAVMKRHSGFGQNGTGAIYQMNQAGSPSLFVDLNTYPNVNTGSDTRDGSTNNTLPNDIDVASRDLAAFQAVGKVGLGDIDLSDDGKFLYAINLNERTLIEMSVGDNLVAPASVTVYNVATAIETLLSGTAIACGSAADYRPWALKYHRGKVHVGVVCSAENSQNATELHSYVLSFDPAFPANGFSLVIDMAMDYTREPAFQSDNSAQTIAGAWRPWALDYTDATILSWRGGAHPSPILADIEIDTDGSMILGFMDRFGMQSGYRQFSTDLSDTSAEHQGISGGDVIRFCKVNDVLVQEGGTACDFNTSPPWTNPGDFVLQGEFYAHDEYFTTITTPSHGHPEVSLGGLALLFGDNEVVAGIYDPFALRSGGVDWWSNTDGSSNKRYELYEAVDALTPDGSFSKAVGLGDLELMCSPAPIEIGNYVWEDTDEDGIQDACETPLAGVILTLYDNGCKVCAIDTTDAFGQYYFNDAKLKAYTAEPTDTILTPNTTYHIVVTGTTAGGWNTNTTELTLDGTVYNLTLPDQGTNEAINSDASVGTACGALTNFPFVTLTTGDAGQADHRSDIGFSAFACPPQICLPVKVIKK